MSFKTITLSASSISKNQNQDKEHSFFISNVFEQTKTVSVLFSSVADYGYALNRFYCCRNEFV